MCQTEDIVFLDKLKKVNFKHVLLGQLQVIKSLKILKELNIL